MKEQKSLTRFWENGAPIPPMRATADDIPRPADLYIELELYFTNSLLQEDAWPTEYTCYLKPFVRLVTVPQRFLCVCLTNVLLEEHE